MLVLMVDDVGIDQISAYGVGSDPPPTPTLDCLCNAGLRFDNVWAAPYCSPARVALLSGLHPRRYDIGRFLNVGTDDWEMPLEHPSLAAAVVEAGYSAGYVGKWHVGSHDAESGSSHPTLSGFHPFSGTLGNLYYRALDGEGGGDYDAWEHLYGPHPQARKGYITEATIDDAIEMIPGLAEPWLMVVSLHAPHGPLHEPPRRLLGRNLGKDATETDQYRAMLEVADRELGRLLHTMDRGALSRTQIWTMSDNGTPKWGILPPLDSTRGKGTLFEGGVRIPLAVTGAGVGAAGEHSEALVSILDVYTTVLEGAGATLPEHDGQSLIPLLDDPELPHRTELYADLTAGFLGIVTRTLRTTTDKIVLFRNGDEVAYALGPGLEEVRVDVPAQGLRETLDDYVDRYAAP